MNLILTIAIAVISIIAFVIIVKILSITEMIGLSIPPAAVFAISLYINHKTTWGWLIWLSSKVCWISGIILSLCILFAISLLRTKTIRIAKHLGIFWEKETKHYKGSSGYATYNANTGNISYTPGTPGYAEENYRFYDKYELPNGSIFKINIDTPPNFYETDYKNSYQSSGRYEFGSSYLGTLKTRNGRVISFQKWEDQDAAKREWEKLSRRSIGNFIKGKTLHWKTYSFLSVILINALSVFLIRLNLFINDAGGSAISSLPAGGFYIFILLALLLLATYVAPFIAVPMVLYKLYEEYETLKVFLPAFIGFPISYLTGIAIEMCFDTLLKYNVKLSIIVNSVCLAITVVMFIILFTSKFLNDKFGI